MNNCLPQKWQLMAWLSCYPPSPFPQNNVKKLIDRTLIIFTNIFQTREQSRKMNKGSQGKTKDEILKKRYCSKGGEPCSFARALCRIRGITAKALSIPLEESILTQSN